MDLPKDYEYGKPPRGDTAISPPQGGGGTEAKGLYVYEIDFIPQEKVTDLQTGYRMIAPLPRIVADMVTQSVTNICFWKGDVLQLCLNPEQIRYSRNIGTLAEVEELDRQLEKIRKTMERIHPAETHFVCRSCDQAKTIAELSIDPSQMSIDTPLTCRDCTKEDAKPDAVVEDKP